MAVCERCPILVTGAAGFIGFHVARRLLSQAGRDVVGVDNLNAYYDPTLKEARLQQLAKRQRISSSCKLDLADRAATAALFAEHRFPLVIHLAAQAGVRYSLVDPHAYVDANLNGFINVLEGCRHNGCRHLVFRVVVVGLWRQHQAAVLAPADNVDHPISLYAASKKANELMAHSYSPSVRLADHGPALLHGLRPVGPAGHGDVDLRHGDPRRPADQAVQPRQHAARLHLCRRRRAGGGAADRSARRRAIPTGRATRPIRRRSSAPWRIYNIGNNNPVELLDVVSLLEKALGKKAIRELLPMQPGDVPATYADVDDLMRDVGFKPSTPIAEGVARFIAWYKEYHRAG